MGKLASCLEAEEPSDCILLTHPCIRVFQQMTRYKGGSLGELSCPVLLPTDMSGPQNLAVAEQTLGAETYFEWGGGSSTEVLGPLAARSYTVDHYIPWCECLRMRPLIKCLGGSDRITCIETNLNLRSFGRLAANGLNNTHKNIHSAHRAYVEAIDFTSEIFFDVVLVDGRAHLSCALKALGYLRNSSVVFVNEWPRKYGKRILQYYHLVRTVGWDGLECPGNTPARCLAMLVARAEYQGDHLIHTNFLENNRNFARSPVNF